MGCCGVAVGLVRGGSRVQLCWYGGDGLGWPTRMPGSVIGAGPNGCPKRWHSIRRPKEGSSGDG